MLFRSDYKTLTGGAASSVPISNSVGTGRSWVARFTIGDMNKALGQPHFVGTYHGITSAGAPAGAAIAGTLAGAAQANNYNAIKIFGSVALSANGITAYAKKVFP